MGIAKSRLKDRLASRSSAKPSEKSNQRSEAAELRANVSTVKVHLGRFLRKVKAGEEVIIMDRQTPVAKIVSFTGGPAPLDIIPPTKSWTDVKAFLDEKDKNTTARKFKKNPLDYLDEERRER